MFRRGCPTGMMSHRFDPVTHRCRCGRWQAGFEPKVEPTRPRAECQICERDQATDAAGCLVHHGYKRPGWGCIVGDCMGVSHKPYPATDALEKYLAAVRAFIKRERAWLASLPRLDEINYHYSVREQVGRKPVLKVVRLRRGDEYRYDAEAKVTFPSFADRIKVETTKAKNEIASAKKDERRVVARIVATHRDHAAQAAASQAARGSAGRRQRDVAGPQETEGRNR